MITVSEPVGYMCAQGIHMLFVKVSDTDSGVQTSIHYPYTPEQLQEAVIVIDYLKKLKPFF